MMEGSLEVQLPTYGKMQQVSPTNQQRERERGTKKERERELKKEGPSAQCFYVFFSKVFFKVFGSLKRKGTEVSQDIVGHDLHHVVTRERGSAKFAPFCGESTKSKSLKENVFGALLGVQLAFRLAAQGCRHVAKNSWEVQVQPARRRASFFGFESSIFEGGLAESFVFELSLSESVSQSVNQLAGQSAIQSVSSVSSSVIHSVS